MSQKVTRLFEQFHPTHYELEVHPDRDAMKFSGVITIEGMKIGRPTQRLTFHQKGLVIDSADVVFHDKQNDRVLKVTRINNQNSYDEVRLHFEDKVVAGNYSVKLSFQGIITRQMDGIYPCNFSYDGQDKMLIATQFESHDARKAFPCIDEPEAKATFRLTLISPSGEVALSNTPIASQQPLEDSPHLQRTIFEITPKMSTYLVAFAYGELGFKEATTKDGVTVRAYATPGNVEQTAHGLDVAVRALEFFGEYFGIAYPLPKLDMIALPDFASGAMENWGLVTYRETTMLADLNTSSIETQQLVALVICHELSHQWFGNLVTMKWWNDLWLNESFANLMEHRAVDALYPEWNIWEQFVSTETASAKRRDSLADVQPIRTEVKHPDEISTLFDPSIVYAKGGSVLYMLLRYLGEEAFRSGLGAYFKKHAYGNTTADDLWNALSASSQQNVGDFMSGWINRPGYPLLTIDLDTESGSCSVEQKRFLSNPTITQTSHEPWQIPLKVTPEVSTVALKDTAATLQLSEPVQAQPYIFNHDGESYYLPYYQSAGHFSAIVNAIKAHQVDAIDRLLLLDNYTLLQRGGISKTTDLLSLAEAYREETNENVWGALAIALGEVRKLLEGDEATEAYLDDFIRKLVLPTVERLGWDDATNDSSQTLHLRGLIISMALGAKEPAVIEEALRRFKHMKQPSDIPATIRSVVLYAAVRYGTEGDFDGLLKLHGEVQSADERDEIAASLTGAKQTPRYEKLLGMLTTDKVRRQDLLHWYAWLLRNRYSRTAAWDWMEKQWPWIESELKGDKSYGYFARYAGSIYSRPDELARFKDFFGTKTGDIAIARDIHLAEQEINSRIIWREHNESSVKEWFHQ